MQPYPANLSELEFLRAYEASTLRKPQVVADTALRSLVLAGTQDRISLIAVIACQLAEACQRLTAVYSGLADRRHPLAQVLAGPLPGAAAWQEFVERAASQAPEATLAWLHLGEDGLSAAQLLARQEDLVRLTELVRVCERGTPAMLAASDGRRTPIEFWLVGEAADGSRVEVPVGAREEDAAEFAALTANLATVARGFLSSYLRARADARAAG